MLGKFAVESKFVSLFFKPVICKMQKTGDVNSNHKSVLVKDMEI